MRLFRLRYPFSVCVCLFVVTKAIEEKYEITLYDEENSTTKLYWSVDYVRSRVHFSLHTSERFDVSFPFVEGFGMSDWGDVTNADILLICYNEDGVSIQDSWSDNNGLIHRDRYQNYHLTNYDVKENQVTIEFWRYFNTGDVHDYQLDNGTTNLIYLTIKEGDAQRERKYELDNGNLKQKLNALNMNHRTSVAQILKTKIPNAYFGNEKDEAISSFSVFQPGVLVPAQVTTYWCSVHKLPDDITEKVHVIGYEAKIARTSRHIIHHMEVFMCDDRDGNVTSYSGLCSAANEPLDVKRCNRVMAAWAKGARAFRYPKEAGIPFGGIGQSRYFRLEIHYNNPNKLVGLVDSSGLTFYYTKKLRQFDAGILEIGLTYSGTMAIPPKQKEFILSGQCPKQCTKEGLPDEGVNIFASQLHAHLAGRKIWVSHYRGNTSLAELNRDNHYSTFFEEIRQIYPPVEFMPGDSLVTSCSYDTSVRTSATLDGMGIFDEMCVSYLHYYPLSQLEVCKSSTSPLALFEYFMFEKIFSDGLEQIDFQNLAKNYLAMKWDDNAADDLKMVYKNSPQEVKCRQHNGNPFPGNWKEMSI